MKTIIEIEEEFDEEFEKNTSKHVIGDCVGECNLGMNIKSFYDKKIKELLEELHKNIGVLVAEEIVIALEERQKTSRLTSLSSKIDNLIKDL